MDNMNTRYTKRSAQDTEPETLEDVGTDSQLLEDGKLESVDGTSPVIDPMAMLMNMMQKMAAGQNEIKEGQNKMETAQEAAQNEIKAGQSKMEAAQNKMEAAQNEIRQEQKETMDKVLSKFNHLETKVEDVQNQVERVQEHVAKKFEDVEDHFQQEIKNIQQQIFNLRDTGTIRVEGHSAAKVKPPTFDGKAPWSTYSKQFEAAATANGWSDQDKATALIVALRGEALNVLQTVPQCQQQDYMTLISLLETRYGDKHLQQVYQAQLKARTQKSNENLQEFEIDVARLVRLAFPSAPEDVIEQLAIQAFIDGVRDRETKKALRLARHKNLADTLAHALEYEAAEASVGNPRVRQVQASNESPDDMLSILQELMKEVRQIRNSEDGGKSATNSRRGNERQQPTCWNCGKTGHFRNRCRLRRREDDAERDDAQGN